ncbi:MAG: transposase, partial [Syntrophobacteraceae bacterium]
MTYDAHKLPKTTEEMNAILKPYALQIEFLEGQNRLLRKALFASKSEKHRPDEGEGGSQLHIFNEAEALVEEKKEEAPVTIPEHTRQRPKRKPL